MTVQTHSDDKISLKGEKYKAKNIRLPVFPALINICYKQGKKRFL